MLLTVVWLRYPEFDPCASSSFWCSAAYWSTQSGGRFGTFFIILITSALHASAFGFIKLKINVFVRSFLILSGLLAGLASINEYVIKPAMKVSRPSHVFMVSRAKPETKLDSLYALADAQRRAYFEGLLSSDTVSFREIDQRVLHHWVEEAGYSFPSGHTFNAFLLGSLLCFSMLRLGSRRIRGLCFVPLVWAFFVALSRVSLGAHSPLDVSVGAAMGLMVTSLLLSIPTLRDLIVPRKPEQ